MRKSSRGGPTSERSGSRVQMWRMPRPPVRTHPLVCKSQWDEVTFSSLDDTFETPAKKAYRPEAFSPGCARDSSDPLPPTSTAVPQTVPYCPGKDSVGGDGHSSPGPVICAPGSEHVESGRLDESSGCEEVGRAESSSSPNQVQTTEIIHLSQSLLGDIDKEKPRCTPEPNKSPAEVSGQYVVSFTLQDCPYSLFDAGESSDAIAGGSQRTEVTTRRNAVCVENSVGEGWAQHSVQDSLVTSVGLNVETSCKTAIPVQPQVKSVNVVPSLKRNISKPTTTLPPSKETKTAQPQQVTQKETKPVENISKPAQNIIKRVQPGQGVEKLTQSLNQTIKPIQPENKVVQKKVIEKKRVVEMLAPRPLMREDDLQHRKAMYVHSVNQHMECNRGQGVMTGLQNLMHHVAEQRPGMNGRPWQHPSDISRRHYQVNQMFTVEEWQSKSTMNHKRFSKVPPLFERSPIP